MTWVVKSLFSSLADEMMNVVQSDQANDNEINSYDVVEEPRDDQDKYPGDERDERSDVSSGNGHGGFLGEDRIMAAKAAGSKCIAR
jgi:hypothetical protein